MVGGRGARATRLADSALSNTAPRAAALRASAASSGRISREDEVRRVPSARAAGRATRPAGRPSSSTSPLCGPPGRSPVLQRSHTRAGGTGATSASGDVSRDVSRDVSLRHGDGVRSRGLGMSTSLNSWSPRVPELTTSRLATSQTTIPTIAGARGTAHTGPRSEPRARRQRSLTGAPPRQLTSAGALKRDRSDAPGLAGAAGEADDRDRGAPVLELPPDPRRSLAREGRSAAERCAAGWRACRSASCTALACALQVGHARWRQPRAP